MTILCNSDDAKGHEKDMHIVAVQFIFKFQDTKLSMIGKRVPKCWTVPAPIRYVKVTTLYFEEVLLLGLLNGQVRSGVYAVDANR